MYKVIIVDDEDSVRERLLSLVHRLGPDYDVVGDFSNGYDALDALDSIQPDILITDIKMPYIDGMELIRQARLDYPLLKVIIISGYDSFDYAKQAIDLKVVGYLSKPISFDELKEKMSQASSEIQTALSMDKNINTLQEQAKTNLVFLQENDLRKLVSMKEMDENFKKRLLADKIDVEKKYCVFGVFDFDMEFDKVPFETTELVGVYLSQCLSQDLGKEIKAYSFGLNNKLHFYAFSDRKMNRDVFEESIAGIISKIRKTNDVSLSCAISEISDDGRPNYRKLYRHAMRTLEYRTTVGGNHVLFYGDIQNEEVSFGRIDENEYKSITYDLSYGYIDECKAHLESIFSKLSTPEFEDSYLYIVNNMTNAVLKACTNFQGLYHDFMDNNEIFMNIYECKTVDKLREFFFSMVDAVKKVNESTRNSGVETGLKKILSYIDSHYADPNLSMDTLSEELSYSISYISLLLKRDGKSFTKYLVSVRMEHAKELLGESDSKIATVSEQVGYSDPYYFSHCFKKCVGVSPVEYRKK